MTKIKKAPPKRLSPVAPIVKALAVRLVECPEDDIPTVVEEVGHWPFPKTDFFHWIPVLNRFDAILEILVEEYDLKNLQNRPFSLQHKEVLLAILRFSTHLWENCTNRSLYNSYEHLNELLLSRDLDVLAATVRLILRPAQRLGSQRSLRNTLGTAQERITVLSQHWGMNQSGLDVDQLMVHELSMPAECRSLCFQFYRTTSRSNPPSTENTTQENAPTPSKTCKNSGGAIGHGAEGKPSGLTVISIPDVASTGKSEREIFLELVEQYNVPQEQRFPLMHKIRLALGLNDVSTRRRLLAIRFMAISVLVILGTEDVIQSKLFTYEPNLIQKLADVLQTDGPDAINPEFREIQTCSIYALDSMAHHRARLGEVLTAINASANHGVLMYILRKVVSSLDVDLPTYPQEFVEALFGFVTYIASTQSGGNMIISAGVLPVLIQLMGNMRSAQLKSITRCIVLLDSLVFGFSASFAAFTAASGLDVLVARIKDEVDLCISLNPALRGEQMESIGSADASITLDLPHERTALLRALLKFVLHMMQTSGTADRMRNLIDTTLPISLLAIFQHSQYFGASVFGLAVNIMSTFIHNEPTCLTILQEATLPQTLLHAISQSIPISAEVISALPNAFGAICLNQAGLDEFNAAKPIDKYLEVLTSEEHLRTLQDNDVPHLVGNSMDELIRHHPSLKDDVMSAIIKMLQRVVDIGQVSSPEDTDTSQLQTMKVVDSGMQLSADLASEDKRDSRISQFIDVVARFLEGLFQNVAHCKDFIKMEGVQILLKYYTLPTLPYDFASSASSYSLSYLFRLMIEVNASQVVAQMLKEIDGAITGAQQFLSYEGEGGYIPQFIEIQEEDTNRFLEGQQTFRSLVALQGFIRLLSDVYCTHTLSHSKSVGAVIQTFTGDVGETLIAQFGAIYRTCVWENIVLKSTVPIQWYQSVDKKSPDSRSAGAIRESSLLDVDVLDSVLEISPGSNAANPEESVNEKDPRVKNTRYFRHLLSQIPTVLTPTLQGILKLLTARRISESNNRKASQKIVDDIAILLRDNLTWERPAQNHTVNKYSYLAVVLALLSVMFVEERSGLALQTHLVLSFHKRNGSACVFQVLQALWDDAERVSLRDDLPQNAEAKQLLGRIHGALELSINVLQTLCNSKLLHDSPLTASLVGREKDKTSTDYFDPYEFVVEMRSYIAPIMLRLWQSPYLTRAPGNVVKSVLGVITHLVKAEGEMTNKGDINAPTLGNIAASIFNRSPTVVADEDKVQQLVDMGFPRAAAETALVRCGNHVARAAEYLLNHPNVVAAASYSAAADASGEGASGSSQETSTDAARQPNHSADAPTDAEGGISIREGNPSVTGSHANNNTAVVSEEDPELAAALALSMGTSNPTTLPAAMVEFRNDSESADMDVDPPTDILTEEKDSKQKGKALNRQPSLEVIRNELKAEIPRRGVELLDYVEEVIFYVKELLCFVGKDDMPALVRHLVSDIEVYRVKVTANPETTAKGLAVRLRLFALIVSDMSWQRSAIEASKELIGKLSTMTESDGTHSPWLPSVLLILEAYVSLTDEPMQTKLQSDGDALDTEASGTLNPLTPKDRIRLMETLVSLLKLETVDKEMLHAILRLTVRLTRSHAVAIEFARLGGVPLLFNPTRIGLYHAQPAMTIMILRHIIEDAIVLKSTMEREMTHWLSYPRQRVVDVGTFVKNCSHIVSRSPERFIDAVTANCQLTRYDASARHQQITLKSKEGVAKEGHKDEACSDGSKLIPEQAMDIDSPFNAELTGGSTAGPSNNAEPVDSSYLSDVSEGVVQFLVTELLAIKNAPILMTSDSTTAHEQDKLRSVTEENQEDSKNGAQNPPSIEQQQLTHMRRCFLLQCLAELVVAYPTCKVDVITVSQKRAKGTPLKGTISRNPFLNHLVYDLLPHGSLQAPPPSTQSADSELQRKLVESNWTTSLISGLCLGVTADYSTEKKLYPDLANVRRCVLDVIWRSLRDAVTHVEDGTEIRYARFLAIADLCFKILTARGPTSSVPSAASTGIDDIPTNYSRMMLEKGFVNLLTQALAEVDVHHPESTTLISAILKPLEFLTKVAIRLGKANEARALGNKVDSTVTPAHNGISAIDEGNTELSDLYRNSALGMYHAPSSDEEAGESTTEESEDDDAYDEFSDEEMSDAEEDEDEEDSDVDDDMEIVVPQPYQGNPDPSTDDDEEDDDEDLVGDETPEHDDDDDGDGNSDADMSWEDGHTDYHDINEDPSAAVEVGNSTEDMEVVVMDEGHDGSDVGDGEQPESDGDIEDAIEDDEDDSEEEGRGDIGDMYEDDLIDGEDDEAFLPVGAPGRLPFPRFGFFGGPRGARTRRIARRQVMEVDMNPAGGLDITWVADDGGPGYSNVGDFPVLGRPLGMRPQAMNEDIMSHPLLVNQGPPSNRGDSRGGDLHHRARGQPGVRTGDILDWQAFDDLIGGNALQILEHLFSRSGGRGAAHYRVELGMPDTGVGVAPGGLAGVPASSRRESTSGTGGTAETGSRSQNVSHRTELDEQLAVIHAFAPLGTAERWFQEARLMYCNSVQEKAARVVNAVLNAMIPAAIEEAKLRKEREEVERKLREEEDERKREEEERQGKEQQSSLDEGGNTLHEQEAGEISGAPIIPAEEDRTNTASAQPMESESTPEGDTASTERIIVTVNGSPVDITGSGIDVTFLEALPDDLRQEVINQHLREQQRGQQATVPPPAISTEFLDALPADIREEVLQQERREQERRTRATRPAVADVAEAGPVELDPASFLATLDPQLRQTVLLEQDDGFLATLPPALVAEANAFRSQRTRGRYATSLYGRAPGSNLLPEAQPPANSATKRSVSREAVHLLDKPALTTLIRLLFLPEPVGKPLLHRALVNLCENTKTRGELVSLLLSILADGSADLANVDKSFAQLSLKGKSKHGVTPRKGTAVGLHQQPNNVPNLVAQRCLETIFQLVTYNEQVARLFLVENDQIGVNLFKTPKRPKGKDKAGDMKYPVVILLSLLQRPAFLDGSVLMEQLMHILSSVLRRLSYVGTKAKDGNQKGTMEPSSEGRMDSTTDNITEHVSSNVGASGEMRAEQPQTTQTSQTPKKVANTGTADKSPVIPDQYVSAVVNVLTAGVCSGKTFQYTLSVIQHLSTLANNRETITRELADSAQRLGNSMIPDLDELIGVLESAKDPVDVQSVTLGKFSPSTAQQAKLLRVLKTIDFIHSKASVSNDKRTDASPSAGDDSLSALEHQTSSTVSRTGNDDGPEAKLSSIYDKLQMSKLWQRLGMCLTIINEKDALIHVATVLLPAIESFLVVSKPYVLRRRTSTSGQIPTIPTLSRVAARHSAEYDVKNNEELFVAFTDEHRKILNTMVRNSPSLMSGSFSLLVQNPKILEFDNKRTYFNQQLHKRTSRDHYGSLQINVRRQYVFEDSYHQLQGRSGDEIKFSKLNVRFYDEEGVDAGGVTREWFSVLARQMFNPDYALFRPSAVDKVTYQPNRLSYINPDHLLYFKFVGRIIGKAIYDGRLLDAYFTRSFYKSMIEVPVDYKDMEAVDPEYHKSLEWILQNDNVEVLDLTFSTEIDEFGKKQTIDLKPNGRDIQVTEENKHEYVKLVVEQRLMTAIRAQIDAFLSGFHDIIPKDLVKIFNEQELELLISGMPDIDIDDWKNNTEYQNYTSSSPQVQWFWRAVRSFSQEERAKLVQFATGTSKVPLEGFAQLQGANGVQKFQIHKDFSSADRLPSAHTCFNQLDLPQYESYEQLRSNLLLAISEGGTGFGFA
ncbi:hypothetical protein SpCBS45565_g08434 [Spizellomyces sp. 'palustris']|nr:hypothetical protein SpCBS45565_g08434 [Spizellomyces sp. 'palustris']